MLSKLLGLVLCVLTVVVVTSMGEGGSIAIFNLMLFVDLEAFGFVFILTFAALLMTYGLLRPTRMLLDVLHPGAVSAKERLPLNIKICESTAIYACCAGSLGTLIGIVKMLGALADPAKIGAGMAVALLTMVYAVGLVGLVFMPLRYLFISRQMEEQTDEVRYGRSKWLLIIPWVIIGTLISVFVTFAVLMRSFVR